LEGSDISGETGTSADSAAAGGTGTSADRKKQKKPKKAAKKPEPQTLDTSALLKKKDQRNQ
jgi:hypothetical protein